MNSNARGSHESPNVYTREVDISSYSTKSLGVTTLGLVGETLIGPAFQPIPISTYKEFLTYFGGTDPEKYPNGYPRYELPYIAKSYLQQSQQLYVTRVLGLSGYKFKGAWGLNLINSNNTTNSVFAILRSKCFYSGETLMAYVTGLTSDCSSAVSGITDEFTISASTISGLEIYKVSLNPLNKNYILKVLGTNPKSSSHSKIYVENMFEGVVQDAIQVNDGQLFYTGSSVNMTPITNDFDNYSSPYNYAKTPWFVSELKGNIVIPLFRFITLSDGDNANNLFKISIKNVDPSTLRFDVLVRAISDTDSKPVILEQYTNCTLDPNDGNDYLGAKIGTTDEVYQLKSKYIIVDINEDERVKESVPMGFEGYEIKNFGNNIPLITYNSEYVDTGSSVAKKTYFGITDKVGIDMDFFNFNGFDNKTLTNGFHLEPTVGINSIMFSDPSNSSLVCKFDSLDYTTYNTYVINDKKLRKFTAYFSGGFDGWDIWRDNRTNTDDFQFNRYKLNYPTLLNQNFSTFGNLELGTSYGIPDVPVTTGITSDFYAFWSAIRSFSDPGSFDINVLATPGIDWLNNSILVNETIDMIENERQDSIYIITTPDKTSGSGDAKTDMLNATQIVEELESSDIDSNYSATYYPWCQYYDSDNGVYLYLPPTRDVVKSIAYTDNTVQAWFPPAGIGRGVVDCVKAKKSLIIDEEDILYSGRINPIKTFALDGVKIWGQKTLQIADTSLNRIGVRRMMLYIRKLVRRSNLPLIFEPNDNTTKNKFLEIVNPILNSVKTNRGISDYKVVIDDSIESKERHEMNVQIWIKPIGALEYINIDFMITSEGFDFSTI